MRNRITLVTAVCIVVALATTGCRYPLKNKLPPAQRLMEPGPGVGGPGPGVLMPAMDMPMPAMASQMAFVGPAGMHVTWDVGGMGIFDSQPLVTPGTQDFPQGGIYRLKVTNIPGRPGVELYPSIEVAPVTPRTEAYLAHNAIPIQFTEEDFDQVLSGNFVTKVIYLPDPEFQEVPLAGIDTVVSTRLDPGVDPIVEADRRGSILCIVRLGNKDLGGPGQLEGVAPVNYEQAMHGGGYMHGEGQMHGGYAGEMPHGYGPAMMPPTGPGGAAVPPYVAGMTAPQYGMPTSGTPIGLPGPPHIPFGGQAGLQRHVMVNHTPQHLPPPTEKIHMDLKQSPGYHYPRPSNHLWLHEKTHAAPAWFRNSLHDRKQHQASGQYGDEYCE
ncbi:MAG: hypothetical protein WEA31_09910 [Pirellulales bacterium]